MTRSARRASAADAARGPLERIEESLGLVPASSAASGGSAAASPGADAGAVMVHRLLGSKLCDIAEHICPSDEPAAAESCGARPDIEFQERVRLRAYYLWLGGSKDEARNYFDALRIEEELRSRT
mmetsp:Transcript_74363/g.168444  ORF Transcript_74363/g.168444 Transcript_74363/m.168444 type:complete len:125 (-) Transcript_74363:127-501(-)|eukprot:CAMPEP_0197927710 /NCGR_PEP_ID=MMETSP1439-20131203/101133_1 /TAXON_ID=66791 /ORGANISM="Gonyaulax spinifera, Strain CCMP409" /LENGTH=124 /DNA_ID=CAMNT_0043550291 /DNA_START=45 /DNA_END=419 /DNA_ORIENTATION=+